MIDLPLVDSLLHHGRYLVTSLIAQTPDSSVFSARDLHPWLNRTGSIMDKDGMVAIKASLHHPLLSGERNNLTSLREGSNGISSAVVGKGSVGSVRSVVVKGCPCQGHLMHHLPIVHGMFSDRSLGLSFLATELLGPSLDVVLSRGPIDLLDAKDMLRQVLCALRSIHGQGNAHYDVKASKVCPKRKKVKGQRLWKIIDFAHLSSSDTPPNYSTPRYAPPESILLNYEPPLGAAIKGSSWDMWSLGCLAFESCTGEKLFDRPPRIQTGLFTLGDVAGREEDKGMLIQMMCLLGPPPPSIQLPQHFIDLHRPPPPLLPSSPFTKLPGPVLKVLLPLIQRKDGKAWSEEEVRESLRQRIVRTSTINMSHEDTAQLAGFLSPLLDWNPLTRSSAINAASHQFLQ